MKYLITYIILFSIALAINIKISNDIKWQKKAETEWHKMLDPMYTPKKVNKIIESCKAISYVLEQEKYYREVVK